MSWASMSKIVREAQAEYIGVQGQEKTPSVDDLQQLLGELLMVQTRAWEWYLGTGFVTSLDPAMLMPELTTNMREELKGDLERTDAMLSHMVDVLSYSQDPETVWKQVTGPLIAGQCYGPPFCSEGLVANTGGRGVTQSPIITYPYANLDQAARIKGEALSEWERFKDDLADRFEAVAGGLGLGLLALGALFLFTRGGR